jgi:CysZ protein
MRKRRFFLSRCLRAFGYPLRGLRVWGDGRLRPLAWPPVGFLCLALGGGGWAATRLYDVVSDAVWARPSGAWLVLWYPLQVLVAASVALGALFAVLVAQAIFTAPWNDALSERVERLRTGREGPALTVRAVLDDVGRTIRIELGKVGLYAVVMLPLFVLSWLLPVVGQVIFAVAGWIGTALFLAFDYMDWPMARRGWGLRRRLAFIRADPWTAIGFGTGCWVMLFIPIVNVLFVPAAVLGGTTLLLDLEEEGS